MGKPVVSSALGSLPDGDGLLVAAADPTSSSSCVVGSVPVTNGSFAESAGAVTALLPQGLFVVGSYSSSSPAWSPSKLPAGVPTICATTTSVAAEPSWTVNGQQQQVPKAAGAAVAGADEAGLQIAAGFVPVRAHVDVLLQIYHTPSSSTTANGTATGAAAAANGTNSKQPAIPSAPAIQAAVQQLQSQLFSNLQQLVFLPDQADGPSSGSSGNSTKQQPQVVSPPLVTSSSSGTVGDLAASSSSSSSDPCISLKLLQHTSGRVGSNPPPAPMFEFSPADSKQQQLLSLPVGLDVLCYAPASTTLASLHAVSLVPALQQQLEQVSQQLLQDAAAGRALNLIKALHLKPPVLGFPVTVCYAVPAGPTDTAEDKLLETRQQLHKVLGLPSNVPMLRFANALSWGAAAAGDGPEAAVRGARLRNVHETLTPPGFGGQVYLVDGLYDYYHYMQDKFNDAGWGCAYRSLQTIISWFKLQHYTSKPVPGHRQIQEILVSTGDKPASLIGSSQWLGSFELGYILDAYLNITYKMVTVNQGADIPSKARELAQHFVTQGTPVMIGGGVLAYTLLGVAFNEDTGEAAFLILDPHYTGGEDLKKIVSGSWVAWKQLGDTAAAGGPLFVKDAFYNFLCPQRPTTV